MSWYFLALAIFFEVFGTLCMKLSQSFTQLWPSIALFLCYGLSSAFMAFALRTIPLGIVYAIWSGVGTLSAMAFGLILFNEPMTAIKIASAVLVILGVIGLRLG